MGLGVAPHTELMSLGRRQENDLGCYYPMPMDRLTLFPEPPVSSVGELIG